MSPPAIPAPRPDQKAPDQKVYFDELADLFATFAADTDQIYRPWLAATLPPSGGKAVDLGCGSGRYLGLLADRYQHVLGVDIAAEEIAMARARHSQPTITLDVRSLLDVTVADGPFDLVFSVNTVHHLRAHDIVLPHLRSLVAPGGRAIVIDITDPGGWATREFHIRQAFHQAEDSYRHRSRDHQIAARVLELLLHPAWLDHCLNDVPLTRPDFHHAYGEHFPGATFTDLHRVVTAMAWQQQDSPGHG